MKELYNSEPYNLIPHSLKRDEGAAISYAVQIAFRKMMDYAKTISLYSSLDDVTERTLDIMALELRTQYYDVLSDYEVKREMVAKTLAWYMRSGTASVLEEYLATLYEGGRIYEWYEYGGLPYFFKAVVDVGEHEIPLDSGKKIKKQIEAYKNVRSWVEELIFRYLGSVRISINYDTLICFRGEFYPRFNLEHLYLNGRWRLDGVKKLSRYNSEEQVEFYPLGIKFGGSLVSTAETNLAELTIQAGAKKEVVVASEILICAEAERKFNTGESCSAQMESKLEVNTISYMSKINCLDSKWKLDGKRKLDGGRYIL